MKTLWILECLSMLQCSTPPAQLLRTWTDKDDCRATVILVMYQMPLEKRFAWRCTLATIASPVNPSPLSPEWLEQP